jgi:hypothetical protein
VATESKDFKVKNGLVVGEGGTFNGTVTVATPTSSNHAATKEYVDNIPTGYVVSETPPENPVEGDGWYKSSTSQTFLYYDSFWVEAGSSMAGPTGPTGPGLSLIQAPLYYDQQYESLSIDLSAYATETYVDQSIASVDVTDQLEEVQIATIMGAY